MHGLRSTEAVTPTPPASTISRSRPPWALVACALPAAAALFTRMRAIDLAYHVRAGALAVRSGGPLRVDPFTFTHAGRPWLNQQWGAQVVFAWAHGLFGWAGVALVYAAASGSGFAFLYFHCRRRGAIPASAAVLTLLGFLVATGPAPRPQVLAVPLFTGTALLLARRDRWVWLVPVLTVIWANVHGSFILAPLLVAFALGDDLFSRRRGTRTLGVLAVTVAATFVTPFGPAVWSYARTIATNDTIRHWVAEWRPPTFSSVEGALFWVSGVAVLALALAKRRSLRPMDLIRLFVFFALAVPAMRGTLWWALAAPPVVAGWIAGPRPERSSTPSDRRPDALALVTSAFVLLLLPLAFLIRSGTDPVTGAPRRLAADAPEVLVDATRRALPAGSRLLVYQPFASWFEYSAPGYPVMVDSRIELYPEHVWLDYDRAIGGVGDWSGILDRYDVRGVVLPPDATLTEDISRAPGWTLIVDGPAGSVYART